MPNAIWGRGRQGILKTCTRGDVCYLQTDEDMQSVVVVMVVTVEEEEVRRRKLRKSLCAGHYAV
jgi:hypothetical protein